MFLESLAPGWYTHIIQNFFMTPYNSIWTIRKLKKSPNVDLRRTLVVLIAFFLLIYWLLYVFGITGTRPTHSYHSKLFLTPNNSIWTIRKLKKSQNVDLMRTLVVLMAFFLLICSLLYAFGITGTRSPHSYHLKLVLALYDSIWIIRKLKKPPNNNIRRNSVALLTLFLLKYRLFYAFGITGTRLTHSYYSKLFLTCYNSIWTIIKLRLSPNVDL